MPIDPEQLRQEIRIENRRFLAWFATLMAAALAGGVAIGRFWLFHT